MEPAVDPPSNDDPRGRSPAMLRAAELRSLVERSLATLFGAEQAIAWMDLQDTTDPVHLARKAARLCLARDAVTAASLIEAIRDHVANAPTAGDSPADRSIVQPVLSDKDTYAQTVVLDALREMFNAQSPEEILELLLDAVRRLGGRVVPPGEEDAQAIPLNLAPSGQPPLLAAIDDLESPEVLSAYLPRLAEDARRAMALLSASTISSPASSRATEPPFPGEAS